MIGSVGSIGSERLTAIGDVVNVASRVESANKEAGTRFLVSEALFERVRDDVEMSDFVRIRLPGTSQRTTLYEISGLTPRASAVLNAASDRETMRFAGREWSRLIDMCLDEPQRQKDTQLKRQRIARENTYAARLELQREILGRILQEKRAGQNSL